MVVKYISSSTITTARDVIIRSNSQFRFSYPSVCSFPIAHLALEIINNIVSISINMVFNVPNGPISNFKTRDVLHVT